MPAAAPAAALAELDAEQAHGLAAEEIAFPAAVEQRKFGRAHIVAAKTVEPEQRIDAGLFAPADRGVGGLEGLLQRPRVARPARHGARPQRRPAAHRRAAPRSRAGPGPRAAVQR